MSDSTDLKTTVSVEVHGEEQLARLTRKLDALAARGSRYDAATAAKVSGFGADLARAQDKANEAVRRGLGLRVQAERQRGTSARTERDDAVAFESEAVRSLRTRMRMERQRAREATTADRAREDAARTAERQAERASRTVEAAAVRRQRAEAAADRRRETEARAAERERDRADARAERNREAAVRRAIGLDNFRMGLRERHRREETAQENREHRDRRRAGRKALSYGKKAWGETKDAYTGLSRPAAAAAVIGMGATATGVRRILGAEGDVDAAEIGTRQYAGLDARAARKLRDEWAAPTAEALGVDPAKMLSNYSDAKKLGLPNEGAQGFAELATKTSEAWSVPLETVMDTLGTVNTLLTAKGGPFDLGKLKSAANALQYLAAKQSTTPEKLISFMKRGAGGADLLGMSMEGGLAFGSASTSLGNQAGQSGSLLDYIAGRVVEMPRLARKKGEEGDQARDLMRRLGYGSAEAMDRKRRDAPDDFLPDFFERFSRIADPKHQDRAVRFFAGREWLGEFGRMVKGPETYREAQKLAKESKGLDAIGEVWELHKLKLNFVAKQFGAGWRNILGEFGKELSPLARQAGDFFLEWTGKLRAGGLRDRFKVALDGLMQGLGVKDFGDLLRNVFGDPKTATGGSIEAWRTAARGFGEGIRDVVGTVLGYAKMFTGGKTDPETLGKLTAKILGFGFALLVVSPFVSILGAIGSALIGLGFAAAAAWKVMRALGVVGGAPKVPAPGGKPGGPPEANAGRGGILGRLGRLILPAEIVRTMGLSKSDQDALTAKIGKWAQEQEAEAGKAPTALTPMQELEALHDSLKTIDPGLAERLFPGGAMVQPQSFTGEDWRGLITPAVADDVIPGRREWEDCGRNFADGFLGRVKRGLGGSGDGEAIGSGRGTDAVERLERSMLDISRRTRLVALSDDAGRAVASVRGANAGGGLGSGGGSPAIPGTDPAQRYGRRFFTVPPGMSGGGGSAASNPANSAASAAMLDAIASTESGKAGYNAVLGNGRYGTPSKPVSSMTVDEAYAFGRQILARHGSSSALGRYQIVGRTMRAAQRALGVSGDAMFDPAMQDRMARWIARNQGLGAWEGLKGNPGAMARARAALAQGGAQDVPTGPRPTPPGDAVAAAGFGGREQYQDLKLKSLEAIGGGASHLGVTDLARQAQSDLPGGVARFGAFNDLYHRRVNPRSKHTQGLAFDLSLVDPSKSDEASEALRNKIRAAGLPDSAFRVLDEYRNPSRHATGGHIHAQFNSAEAAQRYHNFVGASAALQAKAQEARKAPVAMEPPASEPSDAARRMVRSVPLPPQRPAGLGGGGGAGSGGGVHIHQTINGYDKSPAEIAALSQRHVTEAWEHRAHDLEPELT